MLRSANGGMIGNPSKDVYLAYGWKEVIDKPEPATSAYWWKKTGYVEDSACISAVYEKVEIVPGPRHWTPLSIKRTLEQSGVWEKLRAMLVENNVLEDFWGSQYIAEDDKMYLAVYQVACKAMGKEEVDKLID